MTVTHNPRASADQAGPAYRKTTAQLSKLGLDAAVPEDVRVLAEKSVAQTREACDRSLDAFDASLTTFERSFEAAGQGAAAFNRKIVDIARRNVDASFNLATSLAGAKNLTDIVQLQAAFWRKQFATLTDQAEELRALSTKVTADAAEPIKSHVARGADGTVEGALTCRWMTVTTIPSVRRHSLNEDAHDHQDCNVPPVLLPEGR